MLLRKYNVRDLVDLCHYTTKIQQNSPSAPEDTSEAAELKTESNARAFKKTRLNTLLFTTARKEKNQNITITIFQ